jgi:Phage integrase, N-terminal SAM-like domain
MTTSTPSPSTVIAVAEPVFTNAEQLALAGFLAGYAGLTRQGYALDLRQYTTWCQLHTLGLFQARRAGIECFARDLEGRGRARAAVTRRLCTIAGFYRYAVEEDLLDHSPAAHVRRPRLDYESHAVGLDRNDPTGWSRRRCAPCSTPPAPGARRASWSACRPGRRPGRADPATATLGYPDRTARVRRSRG